MAVLVPPVGIGNSNAYFSAMKFEFCIPTGGTSVPSRSDWLHEVKYDGYRLRLERDGHRVRPFTRGGYNWTDRYPWIVEAARKARQKRFVLDGEAVVRGVDGVSDFNALHSRKHQRVGGDPAVLLRSYAKRKRTKTANASLSNAIEALAASFLGS